VQINLSDQELIELFRLASFGKLIRGFTHNMNGLLQNLSMDIEMLILTFADGNHQDDHTSKGICTRLKRLEEDFDKMNNLLKISSDRVSQNEEFIEVQSLKDLIQKNLEFLKFNLYFKHNVEMKLELQDNLPLVGSLPKNFMLALSWLLEALIEELEDQKIHGLTIETVSGKSSVKIIISTMGGSLSEKFIHTLKHYTLEDLNQEDFRANDIGIILGMELFETGDISVSTQQDQDATNIIFTVPVKAKQA